MIEHYITPLYVEVVSDCTISAPCFSYTCTFGPFYSKALALNFIKKAYTYEVIEWAQFVENQPGQDPSYFLTWHAEIRRKLYKDWRGVS